MDRHKIIWGYEETEIDSEGEWVKHSDAQKELNEAKATEEKQASFVAQVCLEKEGLQKELTDRDKQLEEEIEKVKHLYLGIDVAKEEIELRDTLLGECREWMEGAKRIQSLWYLQGTFFDSEHEGEARAVISMREGLDTLLQKLSGGK